MDEKLIIIQEIAHHRNGVAGNSFHAILFTCAGQRFLGTVFERRGHCAVLNLDRIQEHGVRFGENSYRGDQFEASLREAIKQEESIA